MRIESGPTPDQRNRAAIMVLVLILIAGWCALDGWIRYPAGNLEEMTRTLPKGAEGTIQVNPLVSEHLAGRTAAEVQAEVGEPPVRTADELRYFGTDGYLAVQGGAGDRAKWFKVGQSKSSILIQKILAGVLGALGLYQLAKFLALTRRRVILDDSGLTTADGKTIRWDDMTGLRTADFGKGIVELEYRSGGRADTVRLDSYELSQFEPLVAEICNRKGFALPSATS